MPNLKEVIDKSQLEGTPWKLVTGSAGGATYLTPNETHVLVTPPSSGTHTVYLPPVMESMGRTYVVETPTNATGTVTVATRSDCVAQATLNALTAADDRLVLLCTGRRFVILEDVTT